MKSMTGFGCGKACSDSGLAFELEIISVNRKNLEIRTHLNRELGFFEPFLKELIRKKIHRGMLNISIEMVLEGNAATSSVRLNERLLENILRKIRGLNERLEIDRQPGIAELLQVPGVLDSALPDLKTREVEETLEKACLEALDNLLNMRQEEGAAMKKDLLSRIGMLEKILDKLVPLAEQAPEIQKERLLEKLRDNGLGIDADDERVIKEVLIYCDKSDVSEEITRLRSHFSQFRDFLSQDDKPVGRSMDFLLQEMMREIATLGNKASGSEICSKVVQFKTELEKVREQVQNVE